MKNNSTVATQRLTEIHKLHSENMSAANTTFNRAVRIGQLLAEIKLELKHGDWLPWLKANVKFSQQTANNYMRIFSERDRLKLLTISNLTEAYKCLAEPELPPIPPWAKESYPEKEALDAFQICEITAFIMAKRGVLVSVDELGELYFLLLEKRIRTVDGVCEKFDGKEWKAVAIR